MNRKKMPFLLRFLVWLVLLLLIVAVGGSWYWNSLKSPADPNGQLKAFVIQKGESGSLVAERLEQEKLIKSSLAFKILLKLSGDEVKIEAGDYKISPAMSPEEIINALNKGAVDRWVTLIEGWRVEQMAEVIEKELGIESEEFLKAAKGKEGHLFPDTYLFNKDATAQTIASTLENTFNKKYDSALQAKIRANGLSSDQGVILASIIEREARTDEVRTQIAGILLRRFKIGMGLNADATVQYAKDSESLKGGKRPEKFWQPVLISDYKDVSSPYNTYLHSGLPPAPICNPSLSSLKAVADADSSTPYLYYFHDSKGNTYYAQTLEEHNQNIANHR